MNHVFAKTFQTIQTVTATSVVLEYGEDGMKEQGILLVPHIVFRDQQ